MRITILHTIVAALGAFELVRTLHQPWMRQVIPEQPALVAFVVALPLASAAASLLNIWLGVRTGERVRLALQDLAGVALYFLVALLLSLPMGPDSRATIGLLFVTILAVRLAPAVVLIVRARERSSVIVFLVSVVAYSSIALWSGASTSAQGDQVHYLLAADRLAQGSLDLAPAYQDDTLFRSLTGGLRFGPGDIETHVARTPAGDRLVQGYGLALLVAPGWLLAGKSGALLTLALVAALASLATYLLCRDTVRDPRLASVAWALVAFLAPLPTFAGTIYPNIVGAAAIVQAYRLLFTAPRRRPIVAGLLAGVTLLLTPRDGFAVLLLLPFAVLVGRRLAVRFGAALVASFVAAAALNLWAYGVPLPYAGYGFGIDMATRLDALPTLSFHVEIGLPGLLFDRAFGLAGSAPYVFIGLAGIGALLAGARAPLLAAFNERRVAALVSVPPLTRMLLPALVAVAGSMLALSVYRLWQGGWSPPNRYVVDMLPLWAPIIGLGLAELRGWFARWSVRALVAISAVASWLLLAIPNLGYNLSDTSRLTDAMSDILPLSPLAVLPSFQAPDPAALVNAWTASVPLWAMCVVLLLQGFRRRRMRAHVVPGSASPATGDDR